MTWTQTYTPVAHQLIPSTVLAAVPMAILLGLLAFFRVRAHWAALAGLAASLLLAIAVYRMPWPLAFLSAANGAAYGLFPIGWIVLSAIFVYDITVYTGGFDQLKGLIANLAEDRRVQALLIAFSFGAFIEGAAGFGAPVAICAAMLIGLGFRPLQAASLSLIGNTAPVAFGSLGTPVLVLAKVTDLPLLSLSAMVGRQLPIFSFLVPFWLIAAMAGFKRMLEVWPACLVAGGSFALVQYLVSNFHGPWVVDMAASISSIVSLVVLLRFWQPRDVWRFSHENATRLADAPEPAAIAAKGGPLERSASELGYQSATTCVQLDRKRAQRAAWLPWVVLSVVVFAWGLPQLKRALDRVAAPKFQIPVLHHAVLRSPPVVSAAKPEDAVFVLNYLSATGTGMLLTGIISGLLLGLSPATLLRLFARTLWRLRLSLLTIATMLALGFTTRYAGIDATLGLAFASTGRMFPFFSPLLGWLGTALTGSDTASNVLFGNLQRITATQLGFSPVLAAASNSSGGVMGKMIDAQSIVVAGVATGQQGGEGDILRLVFFHSIAMAVLVGILVLAQATLLSKMVPSAQFFR